MCSICGKRPHAGRSIKMKGLAKKKGGVGRKTVGISKRTFRPNIQIVRAVVEGETKRIRVCASCLTAGRVVKPTHSSRSIATAEKRAKARARAQAEAAAAAQAAAAERARVRAEEQAEAEAEQAAREARRKERRRDNPPVGVDALSDEF
jgi:large subunit ribosomal protein L28